MSDGGGVLKQGVNIVQASRMGGLLRKGVYTVHCTSMSHYHNFHFAYGISYPGFVSQYRTYR